MNVTWRRCRRSLSVVFAIFCVLAVVWSVQPPPAAAAPAVIYVDAVNGDDKEGDGSIERPFLTIGMAMGLVEGDITIECAPGTYEEDVVMKPGVTLQGSGAERTIINGTGSASVIQATSLFSTVAIRDVTVRGGAAMVGGGVLVQLSAADISGCIIYGSDAVAGGNVCFSQVSGPTTLVNCVVRSSSPWGSSGGGIWMTTCGANVSIVNCTVYGNRNTGIEAVASTPVIRNCVVWGNGDDLVGCSATYSNIEDGDAGAGNISERPVFRDLAAWDLRPAERSPGTDEGTADHAPDYDLLGEWRPRDGDNDGVPEYDMGAYESTFSLWATIHVAATGDDVNGNGSSGAPFRSIGRALSVAMPSPGAEEADTVLVHPGTYSENLTMPSGVTLSSSNGAEVTTVTSGSGGTVITGSALDAKTVIEKLTITGANHGGSAGGILVYGGSSPTIRENRVVGNVVGNHGAGILVGAPPNSPRITRNLIYNNIAGFWGGGITSASGNRPLIDTNVISCNIARYGGGIWIDTGSSFGQTLFVQDNTIVDNLGSEGGYGGIYYNAAYETVVMNNVMRGNGNDCAVGGLGGPNFHYNCYESATTGSGTGNIIADPRFVDRAAGDYRLAADSPCIDTGAPPDWIPSPGPDFLAVSRPQDGDDSGGARLDMGAHERPYMALNHGSTSTSSTAAAVWSSFLGASHMRVDTGSGYGPDVPYASPYAVTLPAGEGTKSVRVEYLYDGGRRRMELTDTITLDTSPPAGHFSLWWDQPYATSAGSSLITNYVDGAAEMRYRNSGGTWAAWQPYAASKFWDLAAGADGTRVVEGQFRDQAGNVLDSSDSIILDTTRPSGTLSINAGATHTNSLSVTLDSAIVDANPLSMRFSDDGVTWPPSYGPYSASRSWTLPEGADGERTVYADYMDAAGWRYQTQDTIVLDRVEPVVTGITSSTHVLSGEWYPSRSVTVAWTVSDSSPVTAYSYQWDQSPGTTPDTTPEGGSATTSTTLANDGVWYFHVRARDAAGNWSAAEHRAVRADATAPAGTMRLSNGSEYTTSVAVTVDAEMSDLTAIAMTIRDAGGVWDASRTYVAQVPWTLPGPDGSLTVEVRYVDQAGNATIRSDSIILDRAAPDVPFNINGGDPYTGSRDVTFDMDHSGSGAVGMRFDDGTVSTDWLPIEDTYDWTLPEGEGPKNVRADFRDAAGNISVGIADGIVLDITRPAKPTNPTAVSGNTTATLDWEDVTVDPGTAPLAGYDVERATSEAGPFDSVTPALLPDSSFADTGLSNDEDYHYRIYALDSVGNRSEAATASASPRREPLRLTMTTPSTILSTYGQTLSLEGVAASDSGADPGKPMPGKPLKVETSGNNVDWASGGSAIATTGVDGSARIDVKPYAKTYYRLAFDGDSTCTACCSGSIAVTPRVYLSRPYSPSSVYRGRRFSSYGYLKPRHTARAKTVRLQFFRYESRRWKLRKTSNAVNYNYSNYTKYKNTTYLPYRGRWKVRAYAPTDAQHYTTIKGYDYIKVK